MNLESFTFTSQPGKLKETIDVLNAYPIQYQHDKVEALHQKVGTLKFEHRFTVVSGNSMFPNSSLNSVIDDLRAIK